MMPIRLLVYTLIFYQIVLEVHTKCPKGQRVYDGGCQVCSDGYYQPEENESQQCKVCTRCNTKFGSETRVWCTKTTDTICSCRGQFVPRENNMAICKCIPGFGLKSEECRPCNYGYFSTKMNSPCSKWKDCKSGVKVPGNSTSDVVCNEEKSSMFSTSHTTLNMTSPPPNEGAQTQEFLQSGPTTARAATAKNEVQPVTPNTPSNFGVVLPFIVGIAGLLALTAVTCKHFIIPCMQSYTKPGVKTMERRPIEESGDSSRSSLVKQNPVEFDVLTSII